MNEVREQYKELVLDACRIAVKGGLTSTALEDFIIDHIDNIIDNLSEADFEYLLLNGKIPVRDIKNDEDYDRLATWNENARLAVENGQITASEVEVMQRYSETLESLKNEYKACEWDF